jgi:hypothetical protein
MGGKRATHLSSTPQPAPATFKPNEWGKPAAPRYADVPPASSYQRPQAAGAQPVRTGSREVARVDGAGLIHAGTVTGTPEQLAQHPLPKVVQSD